MEEKPRASGGAQSRSKKLLWWAVGILGASVVIYTADKIDYRHQVRFQTEQCINRIITNVGPMPEGPLSLRQDVRERTLRMCHVSAQDIVRAQRGRATLWERGLGVLNGSLEMNSRYWESTKEWADRMRRKWDKAAEGNE